MNDSELEKSVQNRLLDAAEKLFCERGFGATSVRDLTAEAGCNVAAVNYHFGGKDQLYLEMFRRQMKIAVSDSVAVIEEVMSSPSPSLEALIRGWVTPPLKAVEQNDARGAVMQLLVREFLNKRIDPEPILKDLKEIFVERMSQALRELVPGLDVQRSRLAVFSVDALMFHPFLFMPIYLDWIEGIDLEGIIDHIVRFGAAAIRGYHEDGKK
jgi:AcrR family transcriptional regulator